MFLQNLLLDVVYAKLHVFFLDVKYFLHLIYIYVNAKI